ncbi:PIN domain-containing protein [Candidatus Hydrogenedentota bacterium]
MTIAPVSKRLRSKLEEISDGLMTLMPDAPIERRAELDGILVVAPGCYWGELSASLQSKQIELKREYDSWAELLLLLFSNAPNDISRDLKGADSNFRTWSELGSNWSLSLDPSKNELNLREAVQKLEVLIDVLDASPCEEMLVIPDTNSLLSNPDPAEYEDVVDGESFTFLLLPTVLGELDQLKLLHRNPDVREKAKKVIGRIKGWRKQGSLASGITVNRSITVRTVASEPNMESTLSWLDGEIKDDRIIASLLEIEALHPNAIVVHVTGDINLQNKCDAAMVQTAEIENT